MKHFNLLFALPTWLLMRLQVRFVPDSHPWKHEPPDWKRWTVGRTSMVRSIDVSLWIAIALFMQLTYQLIYT